MQEPVDGQVPLPFVGEHVRVQSPGITWFGIAVKIYQRIPEELSPFDASRADASGVWVSVQVGSHQ